MLRKSGLADMARMVREPQPTDRRQFQGVQLLARKAQARTVWSNA
jgi:hypothetical protein